MSARQAQAAAEAVTFETMVLHLKQQSVVYGFERSSGWLLIGGGLLCAGALALAFFLVRLGDASLMVSFRWAILAAVVIGFLLFHVGVAVRVFGVVRELRRHVRVMATGLDDRYQAAKAMAETYAATLPRGEIRRMSRYLRMEIRLVERFALKVAVISSIMGGFSSLAPLLTFLPGSHDLAEMFALAVPAAVLSGGIASALMQSFTDRLIRAEHVLSEAELMSGVG